MALHSKFRVYSVPYFRLNKLTNAKNSKNKSRFRCEGDIEKQ